MVYYCAVSDLDQDSEEETKDNSAKFESIMDDDFLDQAEAILASREPPSKRAKKSRRPLKTKIEDELKDEFACLYCNFSARFQGIVDRHTIKAHSEDPDLEAKFSCELCGQSFWTERSFDLHLLKEHPDFANSKCNDCGLQCKNEADLKEHLMALHGTTEQRQRAPKNECSACGKNFLSKIRLNKHKREAHNDFDFEDEPKKSSSKY